MTSRLTRIVMKYDILNKTHIRNLTDLCRILIYLDSYDKI